MQSTQGEIIMSLDEVIGMNVAEVIRFYGHGGNKKDRTIFTYRDEDENIQAVSFKQFYDKSINYAALIQEIKREKGKTDADRFHIGFFMQNTPEVIYLLGGCAFTNSTLVGLNNAQIGETFSDDKDKLIGRVAEVTLQDLSGDFSKMHIKLQFKINEVTGLQAHTRYIGHDQWISRILEAAAVFGPNRVIPNFVAGVEMAPPNGFDTIDEAIASTAGGLDFFMSHGISPRFTTWCPEPLSVLGRDQKGAPLEYHIRLLQTYRDLRAKYKLPPPVGYGEPGLGKAVFSVSSFMDVLPPLS